MIFTSFNFLIFFPLATILYWILPSKARWPYLLLVSYLFYFNIKPVYALLLAGVTVTTWLFTRLIGSTRSERGKKWLMLINIILILLPLFFFKYFNMVNDAVFTLLGAMHVRWPLPDLKLLLPVGISYYTFMAMGYTIDVYNEKIEPEKNIGIVALFVSFFPLILSGPIERATNMFPQFRAKISFNYEMAAKGLKMMLWGYFMKLVVADRVAIYVDAILTNSIHHNGTSLLFASILYPFQLYADLGGYSLIAIGVALTMGINVMQNFRQPFCATSMAEFWRRWHISFISWLTDYVYTPLSFTFRRFRIRGIIMALMLTFFISGVWHGAALTFIVWGLMQGVFLSIEALMSKKKTAFEKKHNLAKKRWYIFAGICVTFFMFAVSLIVGKADSLQEALFVAKRILLSHGKLFIGSPANLIYALFGLSILLLKDFLDEFFPKKFRLFDSSSKVVRVSAYCSVILLILLIGVFDGGQFIYFQF